MNKKSFLIFCLAFLSTSFGVATLAPLIPQMAQYFGVKQIFMSRVSWYYMLPYGIFALLWAPLTRVVTIKNIFTVTTFGFSLSTLAFAFSSNVNQAFVAQCFVGAFGCSFMPLSLITIGKVVPRENKGKAVGILFGLAYISSFIGVLLSGFLKWKTVYLIPAGVSFLTFLSALFLLDEFDFRQDSFSISYLKTFCDKKALLLFGFIFLASFFYHSLQQLLGVYLSKAYALRQAILSLIFTVATFCSIVFQFAGGAMTRYFNNTKLAQAGFFLMSVFAALLLFNKSWYLMFFLMVLWGSGWALNHVGLSSYLTHLPDNVLRDASSLNSSIRFISGGLGVMGANFIISAMGFKAHFGMVAIGSLLLGMFVHKILDEHR